MNDFLRTPNQYQRVVDGNLKVSNALAIPVFTGAPTIGDAPNEAGYIGINSVGNIIVYDGTNWNGVGLPSGGTNLQYFRGDGTFQTLNTGVVPEATNLYYTQARFDAAFTAKSTTNLSEGTNLYFTTARFNSAFGAMSTTNLSEGSNLYYTAARFNSAFSGKTTSDLAEGTNLYFTNARVQAYSDGIYLKQAGGTLTGDVQQATLPVNSTSLITKGYVDNAITGISWKQEVSVATTANITLSGTQTIDGVALAAGTRVLVKNQTDATTNGIYLVASGAWTRTTDADSGSEIGSATVLVRNGTTLKNTQWTCTNSTDPNIGTDAITFGQISGAGTYVNGTGISLSGNSFSLNLTYTDARYVALAGAYANPAWITSLAQSKITYTGTTAQYVRGDGTFATFPTAVSAFTNDAGYLTTISGIAAGGDLTGTYANPIINTINAITKSYYDPTSSIQTQLNGKQPTLATPTAPLTLTGNVLAMAKATGTTDGYIAAADFANFASKQGTLLFSAPLLNTAGTISLDQTANYSWTGTHTFQKGAVGTAITDAIYLQSNTAAASGAQQNSPALHFRGNTWSTTSAASKTVDFFVNVLPAQTSAGYGYLQVLSSLAGGTQTQVFSIGSDGTTYLGINAYANGPLGCTTITTSSGGIVTTANTYSASNYLFAGGTSVFAGNTLGGVGGVDLTGSTNRIGASVIIPGGQVYGSGISNVNAWGANMVINPRSFTTGYPGTSLTNNATLYINGAGTGAVNNYALYVSSGINYFGADIVQNTTNSYTTGGASSLVRNVTSGRFETVIGSAPFTTNTAGTNAAYTILLTQGDNIILPVITANQNVTFPAIVDGKVIWIWNQNTAAFTWNITGTVAVKSAALATQSTITNQTYTGYIGSSAQSAWIRII